MTPKRRLTVGCQTIVPLKPPQLETRSCGRRNAIFERELTRNLDDVLAKINRNARVIICGTISHYNNTTAVQGPENYFSLLVNRDCMEGIVILCR